MKIINNITLLKTCRIHCSIQCFKSMQKKTKEGKGCDSATKFEEFNNLCCKTCEENLINSFCSTCKEASQCLECSGGQTCPITKNDCNIHSLSFSFGDKKNENGHEIGKMRKISWVEGTQEILKDLSPSRSSFRVVKPRSVTVKTWSSGPKLQGQEV